MLHPLIPFITEEIWLQVAERMNLDGDTIMLQAYPSADAEWDDDDAEEELEWVKRFILGLRQIRGEMDISPGKALPVLLQDAAESDLQRVREHAQLLTRVGRVESINTLDANEPAPASATALLGDMRILVPMKGVIDVDAELGRLQKHRERAVADLSRCRGKLDNDNFVSNAPVEVVDKERARAAELERQIAQLEQQIDKLAAL